MREGKNKNGFTLVELIIAFAIIVIIFAAVVPQFSAIRNSWASTEAKAEIIQNGRVLAEHITRKLSAAKQIISVSPSSNPNGFITFRDNNDINDVYKLSGGYVVFGVEGSEAQLAGPVDRFQISCYSLNDLNNPTADVNAADVNAIRLVQIETDFPNNDALGTDKTFTASAYLQTNADTTWGLVGHWKLDETSGTTAADSSGNGHNGTLVNMDPATDWVTGQIGNALALDGTDDHVTLPIGSVIGSLTNCTIATWVNWSGGSSWQRIWEFGSNTNVYMFLTPNNGSTGALRFAITRTGSAGENQTTSSAVLPSDGWHHVAVTIDADNHTHSLYLDGNRVAQNTSATLKPSDLGSTTRNRLGRSQTSDPYFNGLLDDVRIYNYSMNAEEVAQLADILRYRDFKEDKAASDSNTSVTISTPTVNSGDLLITAVATDGDTSASIAAPVGQGWTLIDRGTYGGEVTLGVWWKLAGASEPSSHAFNWTEGQQAYGWMMRFTGHDSANPIHISSTAGESSSTPTSPAVTTTLSNCLILRLGAFDDSDINTLPEPGNPGLSGHTAITMDKNASRGATVAILGSWVTGTTHAKESGTNRALVFIAYATPGQNPTLTAVSYGGQSMTKVTEQSVDSGSNRTYVAAFILNAAGITAAGTTTFTPTWSGTPNSVTYSSVFLQNVNQTTLTGAFGGGTVNGTTVTTSALATGNGNMVIEAAACNATGTYTMNNSFTKDIDLSVTGYDGGCGHKSATGANETPSVTHETGGQVLIGFVVEGAGFPGEVSGGAGYVRQLASGSSGTSTFLLGLSNEARTLTIAIAPASQDVYCGGQIRP